MATSLTLGLGGYTIVFVVAAIILVVILCSIFVFRQIRRLRINSARREINSAVATEVSKKARLNIVSKIDAVGEFRRNHCPKLTDCSMIAEHANTPYIHRMIGFDEVTRDVDRQLEFINPLLARLPGQSTYSYLREIRQIADLEELRDGFIERLSFLYEVCRFRTQVPFGEADLEELRTLLREFVKILNKNQAALSAVVPPTRTISSPSGGLPATQASAAGRRATESPFASPASLFFRKGFKFGNQGRDNKAAGLGPRTTEEVPLLPRVRPKTDSTARG